MRNSTEHLPTPKQTELHLITSTILKNCPTAEKIILFGSYARGNYKEAKDIKSNSKSGHVSDYDILVVTEKKEVALDSILWSRVSEELTDLHLSAYPKLLTHDITELNRKLSEGQYFFSDIKREGILLFDSGRFELAEAKRLSKEEKLSIAKKHFEYWFKSAEEFYADYKNAFKRKSYEKAAFYLHQSAESAYKALLLTLTSYTPREHFLEILSKEAEKNCPELKTLFPKSTKQDEDRFKLLEYAYIGGRYDPEYQISKEDLGILTEEVERLLSLIQKVCQEKIQKL